MQRLSRVSSVIAAALAAASFAVPVAGAQATGAQANSATMPPRNSDPNPYQTIEGWAKMPGGPHVGLDERSGDRPRRQEHLGRRTVRREQLRGVDARSGAQVRPERQRSSRISARD